MPTPPRVTIICRFHLTMAGEEVKVRFSAAREESDRVLQQDAAGASPQEPDPTFSAEGLFEANLGSDRLSRVLGRIQGNQAKQEELRDVGSQLWAGLQSSAVARAMGQVRARWNAEKPFYQIRLSLPPELTTLPWETMYDERDVGFFAEATDYCVLHDPPAEIQWPMFEPPPGDAFRLLVVMPQDSGLNVGAELRSIQSEVERAAGTGVHLEALRGVVHPGRLADALRTGWDVVQFVGHGGVSAAGRVQLRFNSDDASIGMQDVDIERFAGMFRNCGVRLVVLNSCLGASGFSNTSLSGAGPFLLRAGVPAVVAMRYEIDDRDAIRFSSEFYRELVKTGRVDFAVEWARQQVALSATPDRVQGFVAPVLYLAEQIPRLFKPVRSDAPTRARSPRPPQTSQPPRALVAAVRDGRCVPIVGPRLFREGVMRNEANPPGPKELADILKLKYGYPDEADFRASDAVTWTETELLQRVCQFSLQAESYEVVRTIVGVYRACQPPRCFGQLAGWRVPGIVCTYIDGLMWHALSDRSKATRVLNRVNEPVQADDSHPLLLNLRGTVADSRSLVLTEEDHEALWEQMADLSPAVSNLVHKEDGRTLLFLGVSPRDATVRRFIRRLLPQGRTRNQGQIFWVAPGRTAADDAYWVKQYRVEWIEEPTNPFIEALTQLALPRDDE